MDTDARAVDVELSSESTRELGLTLDETYAVDGMVRVKVVAEVTEEERAAASVDAQFPSSPSSSAPRHAACTVPVGSVPAPVVR